MADPKLLTLAEAGEQLNIKERTVRHFIQTRRLGAVKVGRLVRVDPVDLRSFIEENRRPAA